VIYVGIDDTDVAGSRGTNQLAKSMAAALAGRFRCHRVLRHQLLEDPRVPCTTKNGSASITLEPLRRFAVADLAAQLRELMRSWFVDGSDPGLCIASQVPDDVIEFGFRCKREWVLQEEALEIAARHGIHLEGLGGTNGGVIGALAAVGLAETADDGRIVQLADWPDDLSGIQPIILLRERGLMIRDHKSGDRVDAARIDVGKHLRPNRRKGEDVLFVASPADGHDQPLKAIRLP
jgi:tRNA(Ile2) C34 agmatinyltransferase TiaS